MTVQSALIVDDSKSARVMLSRLLNKLGVSATCATSVDEAFHYLSDAKPDLIFMDHVMPDADGLQVVQRLSSDSRYASIPVVMYTSKDEDDYEDQAKASGAVGVIGKPAQPDVLKGLLSDVNALLDSRFSKNVVSIASQRLKDVASMGQEEHAAQTDGLEQSLGAFTAHHIQEMIRENVGSILKEQLHSRVSEAISQRLNEVVGGIKTGVQLGIEAESIRPLQDRIERFEREHDFEAMKAGFEKLSDRVSTLKEQVRAHDDKLTDLEYFISDQAGKNASPHALTQEIDRLKQYFQEEVKDQCHALESVLTQCLDTLDPKTEAFQELVNAVFHVLKARNELYSKEEAQAVLELVKRDETQATMMPETLRPIHAIILSAVSLVVSFGIVAWVLLG